MGLNFSYKKALFLLLSISIITRAFLAAWLELGNDEVYYWTYALYPDWSHYDHPPLVGWVIQLFSLNLLFDSELFIRFSSVVLMTVNTLLMYEMGKMIRDERTGFFAALLYNASMYAFVMTGIFILPDTPQNLFWMLSLLLMLHIFGEGQITDSRKRLLLLLGLTIGLSMISKYTGIFLWLGAGLYIIIYARPWLRQPALYIAILISLICLLPVLIWNIQNNWISFSFQGERVNIFTAGIGLELFLRELFGQFIYANPFNYVLIAIALTFVLRGRLMLEKSHKRILLLTSVPLIMIFLMFALFRPTLPHWSGPAYSGLLLLSAVYLSIKYKTKHPLFLPGIIKFSLGFLLFLLLIGSLQIKFGLVPMWHNNPYHRLGRHDITLDMYGWRALKPSFQQVRQRHLDEGKMKASDAIVAENWFPLANLDYYVARPLNMKVLGAGRPDRLHKYIWINQERGGFALGDDFWYLTDSRYYTHPEAIYTGLFSEIVTADTITILRTGKPAKRVFVFLLKDLQQLPENFFAE
jgi:hypothetical protein